MPRRPRISLPNVPQHIIQRGNNRAVCFYAEEDYAKYLEWLEEYADKINCHNRTYKRTGTLWEGRYKSCSTQAERYLLSCQRYIELNPIRANMEKNNRGQTTINYGMLIC